MEAIPAVNELLPVWVQWLGGGIGLAVAVFMFLSGQFKKLVVGNPPSTSKDMIIPTLTIADSAAFRSLAAELSSWAAQRKDEMSHQRDILTTLNGIQHELRIMNAHMIEVRMDLNRNKT